VERLLQPAGSFPVVWDSFSPESRQQFRGWIDEHGIVHHTVGLYEDYWTGEIVVLDDSGWEMFRIPRDKTYDKYDLQREFFDLGKKEVLADEFTRMVFLPSKISTVADLIPLVFWDAHLQIEQENLIQPLSVPAMMSMESGGNEKATATMTLGSNDLITLHITVPEGEDWRYLQVFRKDDLVYSTSWTLCEEWLPTYQNSTVSFEDTSSQGLSKRYYSLSNSLDSDGDGRSDLYEAWTGTSSNTFDAVDTEGGTGDGMHDWWEEKLFGGLSQDGDDDFDGDGLLNNEELLPGQPPVMVTDPSLYSSDGDALSDMEMFGSPGIPPTDPWNSDVDKPSASILYPSNNTVVVF